MIQRLRHSNHSNVSCSKTFLRFFTDSGSTSSNKISNLYMKSLHPSIYLPDDFNPDLKLDQFLKDSNNIFKTLKAR